MYILIFLDKFLKVELLIQKSMHFFSLLLCTSKLFSIKIVPVLHSHHDFIGVLVLSARLDIILKNKNRNNLLSSEVKHLL